MGDDAAALWAAEAGGWAAEAGGRAGGHFRRFEVGVNRHWGRPITRH